MTKEFFDTLDNTHPFVKVALEGFAGSGKTFTMAAFALGVHRRIGSTKPIAYIDTEKSGRHLRRVFKAAGVQIIYKESRTLADLAMAMKMGREGAFDILMIDSISHIWENFLGSYAKEKNRSRLQFEDWGILKPKWKKEFSDPFVQDRYHAFMCGRAGYEYSDEKDEHGKRQIYKSGVKMKVEGETAYEPDILLMMERFEEIMEREKRVWRECTVLKDRSQLLDGMVFQNPTYENFAPSVDATLEDVVDRLPGKETENTFQREENRSQELLIRKQLSEEIQGELVRRWPGQTAQEKKEKSDAIWRIFNTRSWTKVEYMDSNILRHGLMALRGEMTTEPDAREQQEAEDALNAIGKAAS